MAREDVPVDETKLVSRPSVQRLYEEIASKDSSDSDPDTAGCLGESIAPPSSNIDFDRSLVREVLDETLLGLLALREDGSNGKELMNCLSLAFGVDLSPGTVYPCLHDFHEDGVLAQQELIQSKQYQIEDSERAHQQIEETLHQLVGLAYFLRMAKVNYPTLLAHG
jgi:DNA-binding PadR family transcriptional regulator